MINPIKHHSATQTIPEMEFIPILRGESLYYDNVNKPAHSAFTLSENVSKIILWGGSLSVIQPLNQAHVFKLYEVAKISDDELLIPATNSVVDSSTSYSKYGIVVAEAEIDVFTGFMKNIVICTFCPNFVYPFTAPGTAVGDKLYLDDVALNLASTAVGAFVRPLGIKTGPDSIMFFGTGNIGVVGATGSPGPPPSLSAYYIQVL